MKRGGGDRGGAALSLLGSAVRQDGRSASLTAPNGKAQQALLHAALADAAVTADALACVEAHGTGTALGDPIEAGSLAGAVLNSRSGGTMTTVGSVKASAGHAEPAAGTAGLVRLALALRSGQAPPNAQLRSLNPHVGAAVGVSGGCALPTQLSASPGDVGGVSSFGYSGTIAHAVVRAAPPVATAPSLDAGPAPIRLRRRAYPWRAPDAPPSPLDALEPELALYDTRWQPLAATGAPPPPNAAGTWLVLEGARGATAVGAALAAALPTGAVVRRPLMVPALCVIP